MFQKYNIGIT